MRFRGRPDPAAAGGDAAAAAAADAAKVLLLHGGVSWRLIRPRSGEPATRFEINYDPPDGGGPRAADPVPPLPAFQIAPFPLRTGAVELRAPSPPNAPSPGVLSRWG